MNDVEDRKILSAYSPATGKKLADIEVTPLEQVESYYRRSREAFDRWSGNMTERIKLLRNLKKVIITDMAEIAKQISGDTGKPLTEAIVADIMPTLDAIDYVIRHGEKEIGRKKVGTPLLLIGKKSYIEYMPRGVVLVISPWNYPFQLAMVPVISALAAGNTVILKPSEVTPIVGKCMEQLFKKAWYPEGVVQVAHGGKELGAAFTKGKPDYIFFTGSVRTGRMIQKQAAEDLIPTTLELGGKDPMIVFADANLERAAKGAAWGAFTNCGQVCMSAERLYVEEGIFDKFLVLLKKEVESLIQGAGSDDDIGSMTFQAQKHIVREQLDEALERGAKIEIGQTLENWSEDMYIKPTIVTGVSHDMKIIQEETFGPLLPVVPFRSEEEAVGLANGTEFGLNASVWSKDIEKARRVASRLVSGAVVINDVIVTVANHGLPFGGAKKSGIGRYHGSAGLRIFCHEKAIVEDRGRRTAEIQWYPYRGKYFLFLNLFKSYFSERRDWVTFIKSYIALILSR
ncbi:aldehyde dehydrogenase family protein [Bacillus massilinigeriensis]|uniref:aldehyde dehydrogenase family protein n=1 Tax=Bacillus mediterraneensis TaxID=1805474 RepID=UPI0008F7EB35|nr:aldehyde dehydrogenase family protein [Bacillus mediterraneensis]